MEHTWRWFGPNDPITLADIRQTGATGIVTALHEIPNGRVWPTEAIMERRTEIEAAGLTWSVVESIPIHEDIKRGEPTAGRYLATYAQSVRNLAACGIDVVCYNFMPILDWTRTDLRYPLPDGGWALRFDQVEFTAFDCYLLRREGAEAEYPEEDLLAARLRLAEMPDAQREQLVCNVIAGLPGSEETHTLASLRAALGSYAGATMTVCGPTTRRFSRR
jgi:mannonate dehydratase